MMAVARMRSTGRGRLLLFCGVCPEVMTVGYPFARVGGVSIYGYIFRVYLTYPENVFWAVGLVCGCSGGFLVSDK
jgi:hypothetical protein